MMSIRQRGRRVAGSGLAGLAGLGALAALLLSGCADTSTLQNDDELVKKRETILQQEYTGNEIPVVDLKNLPDVTLLVPPSAADVYTINPKVGVEGDYYVFNIHTRHGTYMVKSELALVNYCYEAGVVEMFMNCKYGKDIALGVSEYMKESGQGSVNLLVHPVDSVRGVGRSFEAKAQTARNEVVQRIDKQPDDRNKINRDALPGNALDSAEILKTAYQLRVDAYTLNPYLQGVLAHIARDKELGRIFFSGITFLIPGSSVLGLSNDMAGWEVKGMAPGGGSQQIELLLSKTGPDEMLVRIANFYREHIGLEATSGSAVAQLLGNTLYSPRQQAYNAYYLDEIKSAAGLPETVEYLAKAQSAAGAIYNTAQIELIHAMHTEYAPLKAIVPMTGQIGMLNTSGQFIVIPLWDHTRERNHVRDLLIETVRTGKRLGSNAIEVWFIGDCDQSTIQTASAAGITVRRNAILDQTFRFTSLRKLSYKRKAGDPMLEDAGTVLPEAAQSASRVSKLVIPSAPQPAPESSGSPAANGTGKPADNFDNTPVLNGGQNAAEKNNTGSDVAIPGLDNTSGLGQ